MAPAKNSLTLLGTGTSTGVPIVTCSCAVCRSKHPRNKRLRASAWIQVRGKSLLIDTGPDLRQQALRARIPRVDAVLYTHPHADHTHGIDEIRSFNFSQKSAIAAYGNAWTCTELRHKFEYIFKPGPIEGGGIPQVELHEFNAQLQELNIQGIKVVPISLQHGSKECVGYRIDQVAYVTDCSYIPAQSLDRMRWLSVLILDCLRIAKHGTHFNLDQAFETIAQLKPKKTFLTHMGHDFDYPKWMTGKKLPRGVALAYDGLTVRF
jgi:phosphoribosyl 1,2-cyclic phosphate phosphodiesterase